MFCRQRAGRKLHVAVAGTVDGGATAAVQLGDDRVLRVQAHVIDAQNLIGLHRPRSLVGRVAVQGEGEGVGAGGDVEQIVTRVIRGGR